MDGNVQNGDLEENGGGSCFFNFIQGEGLVFIFLNLVQGRVMSFVIYEMSTFPSV
jgi:hypothetical protein